MSTEQQNVEQQLLEQTRHQIRGLVAEIAQLAKSDIPPAEFFNEYLSRVVSALAATGGAVWLVGAEGVLELQFQINLKETHLHENETDQKRHGRLLQKVMGTGEGLLAPPHSGAMDDQTGGNPTEYLLVLGPLKTDKQTQGVVEIFQRPQAAATAQRGYLRFLLQMCELAGDYLKTRRLRDISDRQAISLKLEQFTRTVHASLDAGHTAYTIANEGRRLIDCDRVSVAIRQGTKCGIEAVSGQDLFDKRSNTVTLLGKLASAVVATGEPLWYTGDTHDLPPQVESAVQEYVDESHSKLVAVLPLKKPIPAGTENSELKTGQTIGALIVEQIENRRMSEGMLHRVDVVAEHSASALSNALEHQNLFLLPVWKALGKTRVVTEARHLPKTIAALIGVTAAILALVLVPADFDLRGDGTLQPDVRRDLFAANDGVVTNVFVESGQLVPRGKLLAELRNTDLEAAEIKLRGDRASTSEQLLAVERALVGDRENRPTEAEVIRLRGERQRLAKTLESIDLQLNVLELKKQELKITSPIDGIVVTWDVVDLLIHRAVERGQLLLSVADPASHWELEVLMPEDRMGHITRAQSQLGKELRVRYILATDPNVTYEGRVTSVHFNAEVRGEEGNTVLVKAALDPRQMQPLRDYMQQQFSMPPQATDEEFRALVGEMLFSGQLKTETCVELTGMRLGAGVQAKVHCGRASIGYVWFHDALAFLQRTKFKLLW